MSNSTQLIARVSQLHGKESEWQQLTNFIPNVGECIIYDADELHSTPRLKVGNGETPLQDLPFLLDDVFRVLAMGNSKDNTTYFIDSGRI